MAVDLHGMLEGSYTQKSSIHSVLGKLAEVHSYNPRPGRLEAADYCQLWAAWPPGPRSERIPKHKTKFTLGKKTK